VKASEETQDNTRISGGKILQFPDDKIRNFITKFSIEFMKRITQWRYQKNLHIPEKYGKIMSENNKNQSTINRCKTLWNMAELFPHHVDILHICIQC